MSAPMGVQRRALTWPEVPEGILPDAVGADENLGRTAGDGISPSLFLELHRIVGEDDDHVPLRVEARVVEPDGDEPPARGSRADRSGDDLVAGFPSVCVAGGRRPRKQG